MIQSIGRTGGCAILPRASAGNGGGTAVLSVLSTERLTWPAVQDFLSIMTEIPSLAHGLANQKSRLTLGR
jgi:hypothetical protein